MMAAARSSNQIMALYARKKQKLSSPNPESTPASAEVKGIAAEPHPSPRTFSTHPTYPFPIADLPFTLHSAIVPTSAGKPIRKHDLDLLHFQPFIRAPTATLLYNHLLESLPWYKVQYLARGSTVTTPRFTTVFGLDESALFSPQEKKEQEQEQENETHLPVAGSEVLSAISKQPVPGSVYHKPPRPIPRCLQDLKSLVEKATNETYNFVLVNFYADGTHSISPHADDESFLGVNPCVASLSLGGARDFVMKHKVRRDVGVEKFSLRSGDMVVMRGTTMANWLHGVPKRASAGGRVNVTFRRCVNAKGSNNYAHYNVGGGPVYQFVDGAMVVQSMDVKRPRC